MLEVAVSYRIRRTLDFGGWMEGLCVCVFTSFPYRETLSAAKTVAVLANSFATYVMCVPATPRHFPLFAASKNHVARDWTLKKIFRPSFFQNKIFRGAARALKKMACEEDDD